MRLGKRLVKRLVTRLVTRLGMNRREILKCGGAALMAATLAPARALAQGRYPDRPIKLIVPFAAGRATDVAGRLWAEQINPLIGPADLAAGPSAMMTPSIGGRLIDSHRTGKVRILAAAHASRLKVAPDIPAASEAGRPGMVASNFNGLFAPAGLAPAIGNQLAEA